MESMNDQKLQKWIRWLDRINCELYYLLENRKIFRTLVRDHNDRKIHNPLWSFITSNYAGNMTMGISRQVDQNPRTISLFVLLEDLSANANMITKNWFVSNYASATGEPNFKIFFGKGETVDTELIKHDINVLKENAN